MWVLRPRPSSVGATTRTQLWGPGTLSKQQEGDEERREQLADGREGSRRRVTSCPPSGLGTSKAKGSAPATAHGTADSVKTHTINDGGKRDRKKQQQDTPYLTNCPIVCQSASAHVEAWATSGKRLPLSGPHLRGGTLTGDCAQGQRWRLHCVLQSHPLQPEPSVPGASVRLAWCSGHAQLLWAKPQSEAGQGTERPHRRLSTAIRPVASHLPHDHGGTYP